jgi:cytochrome P450
MRGDLDWSIKKFHSQYGEVVRFSPEELSFTNERAWKDIYGHKTVPLAKDPMLYNSVKLGSDGATSIFNASPEMHPIIRKQLAYAFSDKALREQEPLIRGYIDLLMKKLRDTAQSRTPTDLVRWYNFTTFDLIGDLAIGRSFGCLHDNEYHTWVRGLTEGTKIGPYIRTMATYTGIKWLWRVLAPERVKQARLRHEAYVRETAAERMARGVLEERKDFLSYILKNRDGKDGLTDAEVTANAGFLIVAGSEAASTALSGITFNLLKTPWALERAIREVREAFQSEEEIDFASTSTKLPYLMACISEGMRAFPPGPTIPPRRTPPGNTITDIAGYQVPSWVGSYSNRLSALSGC